MSVPKRVSAMGPDGTELNLDGISKPELEKIPEARAKELTGNRSVVCRSDFEQKIILRTFDEYLQIVNFGKPSIPSNAFQIESQ